MELNVYPGNLPGSFRGFSRILKIFRILKFSKSNFRKTLDFSEVLSYNIIIEHLGGEFVSVRDMRSALRAVYSGASWQEKVDRMPDNQVIAVYYSFQHRGKIK